MGAEPPFYARFSSVGLQSDSAFIYSAQDFQSIVDIKTAPAFISILNTACTSLKNGAAPFDCLWYFDCFNEGPSWQLARMQNDSSSIDDYYPSLFTQDTLMNEIDPDGVFSWTKFKSDSLFNDSLTFSICFGMLHTIDSLEWADYDGIDLGTATTQATSIRAYFNTQYLRYAPVAPYSYFDNFPERLDLNTYPVRLAGYTWQTTPPDSITILGSATDLWMLDHFEALMDSSFIPAATHENGPFPVYYHPQAFGRTGGTAIWTIHENPDPLPPDTSIQYVSYSYRIPSPAEFRMLCNIGLLRGAKGVFPYSIRSYSEWDDGELQHHDTGLLDEDLIPFDAPYEDWAYRERPAGDYFYAPPDSLPPWTAADGSQFDPLYSLPSRPVIAQGDPKNHEYYIEWKFAAYGRLWNSVRGTFRQIAWIAPELSRLWWWFSGDRYDNASIEYDGTEPQYFAEPQIRVFTDDTESTCYLFYVNRFCRANSNPFEIAVGSAGFPSGVPFSTYALDHSRRCLIEGSETTMGIYEFLDTLDAGEARLLQMFDDDDGLDADVRITDPDLSVILVADGDTLSDYSSNDSVAVDVVAHFYNMGTEPLRNIMVYMRNETTDELIATDTLNFNGLSINSCYEPDVATAIFSWTPDYDNIGANILRVYTQTIIDEPDPTDNSATLVYLVKPTDYATEVLDDPWDMTEATSGAPAWKTFDIDSLTGCWGGYTDSISGMFEGVLSDATQANCLYLNTGSGSSDYIDADRFHNFSIAGRARSGVTFGLHWIDSNHHSGYIAVVDTLEATAADLGPYDLSALSECWTGDIAKLWLECSGGNAFSNVRIGWVKLTE